MLKEIDSHKIEISNEDKVLFPRDGITKLDLIEYYEKIFDFMELHMRNRPITMHRFPDGIEKEGFFHKQKSEYFPDWIKTVRVKKEDGHVDHVLCNDKATLVYLANQACITQHVWLSRKDKLDFPDKMIFDLDPPSDEFEIVRESATKLRSFLNRIDVKSFIMTTGSSGLHVVVPLDAKTSFDPVREVAKRIAEIVENENPDMITTAQRKEKRGKKLFLDVLRNSYAQTSVAPYSIRAKEGAPVATPLDWKELDEDNKIHSKSYDLRNIFRRLSQKKLDPWKDIYKNGHSISKIKERLHSINP